MISTELLILGIVLGLAIYIVAVRPRRDPENLIGDSSEPEVRAESEQRSESP